MLREETGYTGRLSRLQAGTAGLRRNFAPWVLTSRPASG